MKNKWLMKFKQKHMNWYEEKTHQITADNIVAFGIKLNSRYCKVQEVIEMLVFCNLAAAYNISQYIDEVFYDSKSCLCSFVLSPNVQAGDLIAKQIYEAAKQSISQFILFEEIYNDDC